MVSGDLCGFAIFHPHYCQLVQLQVPGLCTFLVLCPAALGVILVGCFLTFETIYDYRHLLLPVTVENLALWSLVTSCLSSQFAVFLINAFMCFTLIFSKRL